MELTITTLTGVTFDGVLLTACGPGIRVAIRGFDDVVEFCLRRGEWFSEQGEPVKIEPSSTGGNCDLDSPVRLDGDLAVAGYFASGPLQVHVPASVN